MNSEKSIGKKLRCAACGAENERDEPKCKACGGPLERRRRRGVAAESDTPFAAAAAAHNRPALRAYRLAVISIIPGAGLVLGPAALLGGWRALSRARNDPHFTARGPALAAVVVGAAVSLTNWSGFILMYIGLHSVGWL